MKVKTRRPFTLLEVLLSLSLLSFILFFFLGHLRSGVMTQKKLEKAKEIVHSRFLIQQKLSQVFSKVEKAMETAIDKKRSFFFTTKKDNQTSLEFLYDQQADPDPNFSGVVPAKLYVSDKNELLLEVFSSNDKETSSRMETLLTHVKSIEFNFYKMPNPFHENKERIHYDFEKSSQWKKTEKELPAILKLLISYETSKKKIEVLEYSFFISSKIKEITFAS